jgi:hypothetical protein
MLGHNANFPITSPTTNTLGAFTARNVEKIRDKHILIRIRDILITFPLTTSGMDYMKRVITSHNQELRVIKICDHLKRVSVVEVY